MKKQIKNEMGAIMTAYKKLADRLPIETLQKVVSEVEKFDDNTMLLPLNVSLKLRIRNRLEYLREELRAERISYGELHELQTLAPYIDKDDVELLEAAGIPEN